VLYQAEPRPDKIEPVHLGEPALGSELVYTSKLPLRRFGKTTIPPHKLVLRSSVNPMRPAQPARFEKSQFFNKLSAEKAIAFAGAITLALREGFDDLRQPLR
jgi:hypothetical protein